MKAFPHFKINIGLNIVAKRPDGFHELQTVFYPVDTIRDELDINRIEKGVNVEVRGVENLCPMEENLCIKAFRLLQQYFSIDGIDVVLTKNIPFGAGLGGGSADAAVALKMYNELFDLKLSKAELLELAAKLGSDTAFFIEDQAVYATGRGELMQAIPLDLSNYRLQIVKPDFGISTKEAYSGVTPHQPSYSLRDCIQRPVSEWKDVIANDFEQSLFPKFPELLQIKEKLYADGALYASLSGSGSALFGIFQK